MRIDNGALVAIVALSAESDFKEREPVHAGSSRIFVALLDLLARAIY